MVVGRWSSDLAMSTAWKSKEAGLKPVPGLSSRSRVRADTSAVRD